MNIDGSDFTELPEYRPIVSSRFAGQGGIVSIEALHIDHEGFLWVIERATYFVFNDAGTRTPRRFPVLRKLDANGAELFSVDITYMYETRNTVDSISFYIDNYGNISINILGDIHVLDQTGNELFTLELQGGRNTQLFKLNDGTVAGFGWQGSTPVIRQIDIQNSGWGVTTELPIMNIKTIFSANDDYTLIFNDGSSLYGIKSLTNELEFVLSWTDIGLSPDGLSNIMFLTDGRIFVVSQQFRFGIMDTVSELVTIERIPIEELSEKSEKTVLMLATFNFDGHLRNAVQHFNRESSTHIVQIIDYSVFNTHDNHLAGLTRLNTEIIAGRIPDLLDLSNIPFEVYAARGLFEDLNPFLDADPELNRSDLMDNVLRASEIDGSLYRVFPTFKISTILGNPAFVGNAPGWNISEFNAALAANPHTDIPLGTNFSREEMLQMTFLHNIERFVDWESGVVDFDNDYFTRILELANKFPAERDTYEANKYEYLEGVATGRQLMRSYNLSQFISYSAFRTESGGGVVIKGFPADNRNGNRFIIDEAVAITIGCQDKQGAWEFVRTLLTESYQREYVWNRVFSVNKIMFEESLAFAMDPAGRTSTNVSPDLNNRISLIYDELSQEEADKLMTVINSISNVLTNDEILWNIVSESASDFFSGQRTAQDVARVIQSRASRYLAEMG